MSDVFDDIRIQWSLLSTGFGAGAAVLGAEMYVFFSNMIINALNDSLPTTEASQSVMSYYAGIMIIIAIAGLIQGILLGAQEHTSFSVGYCLGILFMVIFLGNALWNIAQPVVTGMVVSLVTVVVGFVLKVSIQMKRKNNHREYYW